MRRSLSSILVGVLAVVSGISCSQSTNEPSVTGQSANETGAEPEGLQVAVVTGGHAFDVPNFYRLFRQLPGIDAYPQHVEHFASSPQAVRDAYDVVLFYGMDQGVPYEEGRRAGGNAKAAIERIVKQEQGIVIMHHALLAWEEWDFWTDLVGFDNRNFRFKEGIDLKIEVGANDHMITEGMNGFSIVDEGYVLHGKHDGEGSVLLTTEHDDAMHEVAWARQSGDCRVFCLTLGHDNLAWANQGFRTVLRRGIEWAGK